MYRPSIVPVVVDEADVVVEEDVADEADAAEAEVQLDLIQPIPMHICPVRHGWQ